MRKVSKKRQKEKADKLFSLYIRQRDGKCVRCSRAINLQCAHIIGRRNLRLRYDPQNAVTLCGKCHLWWHEHIFDSTNWFEQTFPQNYKYLMKAKNEVEKPDYAEIIESLNNLLDL